MVNVLVSSQVVFFPSYPSSGYVPTSVPGYVKWENGESKTLRNCVRNMYMITPEFNGVGVYKIHRGKERGGSRIQYSISSLPLIHKVLFVPGMKNWNSTKVPVRSYTYGGFTSSNGEIPLEQTSWFEGDVPLYSELLNWVVSGKRERDSGGFKRVPPYTRSMWEPEFTSFLVPRIGERNVGTLLEWFGNVTPPGRERFITEEKTFVK